MWEEVAGAGVSAVGSILSSRSANAANTRAVNQQTMTNLYEGQKTRDFNQVEAEKARQFNAEQASMSRDWSAQQAAITRGFDSAEAAVARQWAAGEAGTARDFNRAEAEAQRAWAAGQADKQMAFQERMRGTQYQTAMADMRAAGLNPMLAYSQGGAGTPIGASGTGSAASASVPGGFSARGSTPGGATASGGSAHGSAAQAGHPLPRVMPDIPSLISTALQVAQLRQVEAGTEKLKAETFNTQAERLDRSVAPQTYSVWEKQERAALTRKEADWIFEKEGLTREQRELVREEIKNAQEQGRKIRADTSNVQANTVLRQLERNEAAASSKYWGANPDNFMFSHIIKMLGEAVSSATGLRRLFGR